MEPPVVSGVNYDDACPVCNDEIQHYVLPVKRDVLSKFLADAFINNPSGVITPTFLVENYRYFPI